MLPHEICTMPKEWQHVVLAGQPKRRAEDNDIHWVLRLAANQIQTLPSSALDDRVSKDDAPRRTQKRQSLHERHAMTAYIL